MARKPFGYTTADVTLDASGNIQAGVSLTVWTAQTGGTQVTDLQTTAGVPLTGGVVVSDVHGQIGFLGPADGTSSLWVDGGAGVRYLMNSTTGGGGGTGTVSSVNGNAGPVVVLTATDVGADAAGAAATAQAAAATDATAKVLTETNARIAAAASKADLVGGVVPTAQLPALALTTAVPVANQAAMLALTTSQVQPGDIAVRADGAGSFILTAADPSVLGNWLRINAPTDAVASVNGQTGTVVLSAADVGADTVAQRNAAITTALATSVSVATFDAAGDLLVGTGNDAYSKLTKGTALQTLRVNAAGTALEYADPAAGALTFTPVKTGPYTVAVGEIALMNVAGGGTPLTLPAAPADKAQVGYRAIGATTAVPLVVNRGGSDTIGISGAASTSIALADEITVLQYQASSTRWLAVSNVKTQASLDARYDAAGVAASLDVNQRLISYYGLDSTGTAPNKPWAEAATIGPNLWDPNYFTTGGGGASPSPAGTANTSTTQTTTGAAGVAITSNRIIVPSLANLSSGVKGESAYTGRFRIRYTVTVNTTSGTVPSWDLRAYAYDSNGSAVISGTYFSLPVPTDAPNGRTFVYEGQLYTPGGAGQIRFLDITNVVQGSSWVGNIVVSNVSVYAIGHVTPYLKVAFDRTPAAGAQILVQAPLGQDSEGESRTLQVTYGIEGGNNSAVYPIGATVYYDKAFTANVAALPFQTYNPTTVGAVPIGQLPSPSLHINNNADIFTVYLSAGTTTELRGNTHGGETGRTGTWTTDNQLFVDLGDGTWTQVTTFDNRWNYCRRAKIVTDTVMTRSDQSGTPFVRMQRTYTIFGDGTTRVTRTATFLTTQQISKWFYHMTSQVNSPVIPYQYRGKVGRGQTVLAFTDYATKLAPPAPTGSPTTATTGGALAAGIYSVRITALNAFGESTGSTTYRTVTVPATTTTNTITATWTAVTGATGYAIYVGPLGYESRIATVASGVTTYTILGSETPTGIAVPKTSTAVTGAASVGEAFRSDADWTAIYDAVSGAVYGLAVDRANIATLGNGTTGIVAEVLQGGGVTKNYWALQFTTPAPTISSGATFTSDLWFFYYLPADRAAFEREQTYRAASVAQLGSTIYPNT